MKSILLTLVIGLVGCAHTSESNRSQYLVVRNDKEVKDPEKIQDYRRFNYKGKYFAVRQFPRTIYFRNFKLLNDWLEREVQIDLNQYTGVAQTAVDLMKSHQKKVAKILKLGANKPLVYREMERFVNSTSNYFFRAKDQQYRKYTGYVTSGNGINQCTRKIDTSWGLDCSGFVWLAHLMSGRDHPLMKSEDFWVLDDSSKKSAYTKQTVEKFFKKTSSPETGDIVLQKGHVGFFLQDGLSVAMDSDGVSVEFFQNRGRSPKEQYENGSEKTIFLTYVGKGVTGPVSLQQNLSRRLEAIDPGKYFRKGFLKSTENDYWERRKYGQALYYTIKVTKGGKKILGTDFRGRGGGGDLCQDLKDFRL